MLRTRGQILALLGRTLLILPLALALWYAAAPWLDNFAGAVARPLIAGVSGGKVTSQALRDRRVHYEFTIHAPYRPGGQAEPPATVDLEVNGSVYSFGIALFLALSLALAPSRRVGRVLIGAAVLLFVPAWGIGFDALRQLSSAPALAAYLGWPGGTRELIAVGYQLGSLLLPTLAPIALWLGLSPEIVRETPATPPAA